MAADHFQKQPSEIETLTEDFATERLQGAETVSSHTVTAIKCSDETDATSDIIDSDSESAGVVTFTVKAGIDRESYKITVEVTTDAGHIYEQDVIMDVKDD